MKTESVFGGIIFLIIISKLFALFIGTGVLLILTGTIFSLLYLIFGFYFFSGKKLKEQNLALSIVYGLLISSAPLSIVFKFMYYPGANTLALVMIFISLIFLIISFVMQKKADTEWKEYYYKKMIIRSGAWLIICSFLLITPSMTLFKFQYRKYPKYIEAYIEYKSNPTYENWEKLNQERYEMTGQADYNRMRKRQRDIKTQE